MNSKRMVSRGLVNRATEHHQAIESLNGPTYGKCVSSFIRYSLRNIILIFKSCISEKQITVFEINLFGRIVSYKTMKNGNCVREKNHNSSMR